MRTSIILLIALMAFGCSKSEPSAELAPMPESEPPAVVAQLSGFGECRMNKCTAHFAVDASGDASSLSASRCPEPRPECGLLKGTLTDAGRAQVKALTQALWKEKEKLKPAVGCAGCADGPVMEVVLHHREGFESRHRFDPSHTGELPASLRAAASFFDTVEASLRTCKSSASFTPDATCAPELAKADRVQVGIP